MAPDTKKDEGLEEWLLDPKTSEQRVVRDRRIVGMRDRGISPRRIAEMFKLSEGAVRDIYRKYSAAERPTLSEIDAEDIVNETLAGYESIIEELALVAESRSPDGKPVQATVRMGAIKSRLDAYKARLSLLQQVGVVDNNLGKMSVEIDVRYVARAILFVLDDENVSETIQNRIIDVIEGREDVPQLGEGGEPAEDVEDAEVVT